jgi:hypothetical protein
MSLRTIVRGIVPDGIEAVFPQQKIGAPMKEVVVKQCAS